MSLALRFGDSSNYNSIAGAIYFDAVTSYNKTLSGDVTKHPIEAGAMVSDHFVSNNPQVRISGVISHVDFSSIAQMFTLDSVPVINSHPSPVAVRVNEMASALRQFIPDVISQFLPNIESEIFMQEYENVNHKDTVEMLLTELMSGLYYNEQRERWENRMTPTTLYKIQGATPVPVFQDLIITNVSIEETPETGDALFVDITAERVRFVTLEKAEAPKPQKGTATGRATETSKNKGNVPTTVEVPESERIFTTTQIGKIFK